MKIKQFFIDNKLKIKNVLSFFLIVLFFLVYSYTIFSCGYNSKLILEEANKKELVNRNVLVNRKESNNFNHNVNFKVCSSLSDNESLVDLYLYGLYGNLGVNFYSNVYLIDDGILFDYQYKINFGNGRSVFYPSSSVNVLFSYDDVDFDLSSFFTSSTITMNLYVSSYTLPYVVEGSQSLIWELGFEFELSVSYDSDLYFYFNPLVSLDVQELVADDVWFTSNDAWISFFSSLATVDDVETLKEGLFYSGSNPYYFYNSVYDEGYTNGLYDSTNNLFQSQYCQLLIKQGYLYKSYGESDSTLGNGYFNKDLFFKGNHLDFTYLYEALRVDGLFQTASEFMITFDSNTRFYLSNLNLKVSPSSASPLTPVENLNLQVRTLGQLGDSSELFEFLEYDKLYHYDNRNLITNIWFSNSWPDSEVFLYNVMTYELDSYNKGFDSGYDKGYSNGYSDAEIDQDDYYNDSIIPAIKTEYEQLGYDKGYLKGQEDTLNEGSGIAMFDVFSLLGKGFEVWNPILNMQIIPGFTLGVFIAIPIIIGVVFIVIKLLQR